MRSIIFSTVALVMLGSPLQGQAPVDSLDASTVRDSALVGSLIYRAATILTYPKRDPVNPGDVEGDLTTTLEIANTGAKRAEIKLTRCPIRTFAFLRSDYKPPPRLRGFHNTLSCMASDQKFALRAGESKKLTAASRHWKHGDAAWIGPMHFVAELQLQDTIVRLSAGKSAITSSLASVDYKASSSLEGVAPTKVVTTVIISNRGELPVKLEYGECAVTVLAFASPDKGGPAAWNSNPSGMCILVLYESLLAPGYSMTRTLAVPTHDMMREPISGGHYFLTAELKLNDKKIVLDAGGLTLPGTEAPLPASRSIDSVQFSSSVRRIISGAGIPDSLEVMFIARNLSHTTHKLRPEGSTGCVAILGYKARERRDSYYSRPAYDNDWLMRGCQMPIISFDLAPDRARIFVKRMPAPTQSMYYAIVASFFDDAFPAREPYLIDLAADENGRF